MVRCDEMFINTLSIVVEGIFTQELDLGTILRYLYCSSSPSFRCRLLKSNNQLMKFSSLCLGSLHSQVAAHLVLV